MNGSRFNLRRDYADRLKHDYITSGFKQGFEAGYAKAKEDFERTQGEWEYTGCVDDELQPEFCCSICNYSTYSMQYNFCPNCGSDNRPKEGDEK